MIKKNLRAICLALAAAGMVSFEVSAQISVDNRPKQNTARMDRHIQRYQEGIKYYQAGQMELARKEFDTFLANVGEHAGGNFMMGLVQIQLEDLEEARKYLRLAVRYDAEMVAPRGYLGAVEYFLGDAEKGAAQRAVLAEMSSACGGDCANVASIDEAIERIDANAAAVAGETQ